MRNVCSAAVLLWALAGAALAQSPEDAPLPVAVSLMQVDGAWVFRDDDGKTLYTFDRDPVGASACDAQCAVTWPPLAAPTDAHVIGDWAPVHRHDGAMQWAYKGKPVYRFQGDTGAGQSNGEGRGGVWHIIRP